MRELSLSTKRREAGNGERTLLGASPCGEGSNAPKHLPSGPARNTGWHNTVHPLDVWGAGSRLFLGMAGTRGSGRFVHAVGKALDWIAPHQRSAALPRLSAACWKLPKGAGIKTPLSTGNNRPLISLDFRF